MRRRRGRDRCGWTESTPAGRDRGRGGRGAAPPRCWWRGWRLRRCTGQASRRRRRRTRGPGRCGAAPSGLPGRGSDIGTSPVSGADRRASAGPGATAGADSVQPGGGVPIPGRPFPVRTSGVGRRPAPGGGPRGERGGRRWCQGACPRRPSLSARGTRFGVQKRSSSSARPPHELEAGRLAGACKALPGLRAGDPIPPSATTLPARVFQARAGRTSWPGPGVRRSLAASPACRPSTPLHSTPHDAGTVASCCGGATRGSLSRASHPRRPSAFRKLSVPRCASAIVCTARARFPSPRVSSCRTARRGSASRAVPGRRRTPPAPPRPAPPPTRC